MEAVPVVGAVAWASMLLGYFVAPKRNPWWPRYYRLFLGLDLANDPLHQFAR